MPTSADSHDRQPRHDHRRAPQISRRQLLGGLAAGGGALLAACTSGRPDSSSPSPVAGLVDVTDYGARGDGHTDDLQAIRRAFAAVRPGGTVRFARGGVFCHSDVLQMTTRNVTLEGPGRLLATREATSSVQVRASGVRVHDLTLSMGPTTQRWGAPDQHKLYVGAHSGVRIEGVVVDGSAAAGIFCDGPTGFRLDRVQVRDTNADGIHMTGGANRGQVVAPRVQRSGDDGVAVVSYLADHSACHDIAVSSPRVETTTGGRGISVVGGRAVRYSDIHISDSCAASVYIACEGGDFVTSSTQDVRVTGGSITGANTDAAIDHGAVLVYSGRGGGEVSDVSITGLTISGTRADASRQIGVVADAADDAVSRISFGRLHLAASPTPYQGDAPTSSVTLDRVTAAGSVVRVTA